MPCDTTRKVTLKPQELQRRDSVSPVRKSEQSPEASTRAVHADEEEKVKRNNGGGKKAGFVERMKNLRAAEREGKAKGKGKGNGQGLNGLGSLKGKGKRKAKHKYWK